MATLVKFLIDKPEDEFTGKNEKIESSGVFAYFPNEIFSFKAPANIYDERNERMCYSHIGQHSGCSPLYANECKEATPEQYADLQTELESIGYKLKICK